MHVPNETRDSGDNGFSPWKQWSHETSICFHDRVAKRIKNNTLSIDGVAALVLKLLAKADEVALALLREIRYVDSPWASAVNAQALVAAQHNISEARSLLKGHGDAFPGETMGKRMLRTYNHVTSLCHLSMLLLNAFYSDFDMWSNGNDEKSVYVAQILVILSNAMDAMQQCRANTYPDEYVTHDEGKLSKALGRGEKFLRIVIHSLHTIRIPVKNGRVLTAEKTVLLTNASLLISSFRLLDIAAHRNSAVKDKTICQVSHENVRAIRFYCYFRALILRVKIREYMAKTTDQSSSQIFSTIIWALDRLNDVIYSILQGTYEDVSEYLNNATDISLNIMECAAILRLLHASYERSGKKKSNVACMLRINTTLAYVASIKYNPLEYSEAESVFYSKRKLQDLMTNLASLHQGLDCISKGELLYPSWSVELLRQAMQAVDTALTVCESEFKGIEVRADRIACSERNSEPCTILCPVALDAAESTNTEVSDALRNVHTLRQRCRSATPHSDTNFLHERGGVYSNIWGEDSCSVTTPSGYLENVSGTPSSDVHGTATYHSALYTNIREDNACLSACR